MKTKTTTTPKIFGAVAIALILALLVSCSTKLEDAVIGKWSLTTGTERMELFKDGTLMIADKGMNVGGKYTFIDKDRIKVEFGGFAALAGPLIVTVSVAGDEMTWTMPDGKIGKYKRDK